MTEVLGEQYIITAKAKGLAPKQVRDKHASRNAILPVISRIVITIPYLLTGVVIIEHQLNWPGIGTTMFNALYWQDMPMVMGGLMIVGIVALVSRLILDILYAYLDPRVRFGEAEPKIS